MSIGRTVPTQFPCASPSRIFLGFWGDLIRHRDCLATIILPRFLRESGNTHCQSIAGVLASSLLDHRELFCGYDFGIKGRSRIAIEVKGMKQLRGGIAFTDREWTEATVRKQDYWLVVIGNVDSNPVARLIADPSAVLQATCQYQTTIAASWRATVAVT